tara:strand:+ start:31438 stop:33372 length:1935 start_codon:yes stop_codon:yes gene_type:complete
MASIIRVKRSTGIAQPSTLNFGELGLTVGVGTHGNFGGRLFAGDSGDNPRIVGGRYYTDLLSIEPGKVASQANPTTAANGFVAILDQNRKVDQWNVDNLTLDGNTFSSTNTDGNVIVNPNGTGEIRVPDDTKLGFGGGTQGDAGSSDSQIEYDENGTDQLTFTGADVRFNITTQSTNKDTGAVIVEGGVGIEKNLFVGGKLNVGGGVTFVSNIHLPDNVEAQFGDGQDLRIFHDGANSKIKDVGTGGLDITGSLVQVKNAADNAVQAKFTDGGSVELYHNGAKKIETKSNGIIVQGEIEVGNIGISSNIIQTQSGGGNQLFIDPYPSGLSNEGTVIIKGDLQVDGTTTQVNSTTATVNDAIMRVGDVTSKRTVMTTVGSGTSTVVLDSVVGINTGDAIAGSSSIPGNTTIHSYQAPSGGTGIGTVFISNNTTAGIVTTVQLTITHGFDTNTDRGISFNYNVSSGTSNNKIGFFGYNDSTGENSQAPARSFTYIPDATVTNEVVTGTRGNLDIKGIYYQAGDFATHGIVYFDSTGLQNSTDAPSAATFTSTQVMTTNTEIVLTLGSALSVVAGQYMRQAGGGSQNGIVKTTSNTTSVTLIGVEGTFNTSAQLLLNGATTGKVPSNVSTTYTSKPMYTTTIDGGSF